MKTVRIALFASGTGSNAMALIEKAKSLSSIEIAFLLSDKAAAPVLEKAQRANVKTYLVEKTSTRAEHERHQLSLLKEHRVDWILLAGYMRILSADFLKAFSEWHQEATQVVNIHPSLLPAYPGADSIAQAYADQVESSGVTLHLVDEGVDTGQVIVQKVLERPPAITLEAWKQQFHQLEHQIYAEFLESLALGLRPTRSFEETN